jgi:hypothetical protein
MKKFTTYGNCQARAVATTLLLSGKFRKIYSYVEVKPVHELNENEIKSYHEKLPLIDLFIFIPVSPKYYKGDLYSTDSLIKKLKDDCVKISFPCCYFSAYNPEIKYLLLSPKPELNDSKLFEFYKKESNRELEIDAFIEKYLGEYFMNEDLYEKDYLVDIVSKNINELKKRENDIKKMSDIELVSISEYIDTNFRKIRLFNTYNHPSFVLVNYISNKILQILSIDEEIKNNIDFLLWKTYIYPSVHKKLELEFDLEHECKIWEKEYDFDGYVKYFIDIYNKIKPADLDRITTIVW